MNKKQEIQADQRLARIVCLRSFISTTKTSLSPSLTKRSLIRQNQLFQSTLSQACSKQDSLNLKILRMKDEREVLQKQRDSLKKQKDCLQEQYNRQRSDYSQRKNRFFREQNQEFLLRVNSRERAKVQSKLNQLEVLSCLFNHQQQQRLAKWITANELIAQQQLESTKNIDRQRRLKQVILQRTHCQKELKEFSQKIAEARLGLAESQFKKQSDQERIGRLYDNLESLKRISSRNIRQAKQLQSQSQYQTLRNERLISKELTLSKNQKTLKDILEVCQTERQSQQARAIQLQELISQKRELLQSVRLKQVQLKESNCELAELVKQSRSLWRTIFIIKQQSSI